MNLEIGLIVRISKGVWYKGYDLSDKIAIVQDIKSYIVVYIPELQIEAKMLRYEISEEDLNPFHDMMVEDIDKYFI